MNRYDPPGKMATGTRGSIRGGVGLGDIVERFAKPIAKALRLNCLDEKGRLKQESGCAKRRDRLNEIRLTNTKKP